MKVNSWCVCFRNMYWVWRAYLEGTVQVTQSRIGSCDNYKVQIADPAKTGRMQKEQQLRKVMRVKGTGSWSSGDEVFVFCGRGLRPYIITPSPQCIDQLAVVQAEVQDSVKELTKSRKKYQEAETMAQAVREKAELDAK